jgi:adenosine deaminase
MSIPTFTATTNRNTNNVTNMNTPVNSQVTSVLGSSHLSSEAPSEIPSPSINNSPIRSRRFGKTCHAGESTTSQSVHDAVNYLNVTRIGHGFLSIQDENLLQQIITKKIHLEICPVSNIRTGSVKNIAEHPVRSLFDRGVSLSINSDDPGIFDSSIIDDYELCMDYHNFTLQDFYICNQQALQASFLPAQIKENIRLKYFNSDYYDHAS